MSAGGGDTAAAARHRMKGGRATGRSPQNEPGTNPEMLDISGFPLYLHLAKVVGVGLFVDATPSRISPRGDATSSGRPKVCTALHALHCMHCTGCQMVKGHKDQLGKRRSERILHGGVGQRYSNNDTGYGYVCLGPVLTVP